MFLHRTRSSRRRDRRLVGATSAIIATDLVTEMIARSAAAPSTSGAIVPVRNPELSLGLVHAPLGVAALLAVVGIMVAGRLTIGPARRGAMSPWIPAGLMGGAVANLIDRVAFGAVHDFLAAPVVIGERRRPRSRRGTDRLRRPFPPGPPAGLTTWDRSTDRSKVVPETFSGLLGTSVPILPSG